MTLRPFSAVHCLGCGRRYTRRYRGKCTGRRQVADGPVEWCPGPLLQVLVDVPDTAPTGVVDTTADLPLEQPDREEDR